jgi:hypothetical protein
MAIGWLSVLQMVPWGDVISNAPKVADGAKKLWNSVGKKPGAAAEPAAAPAEISMASLQAQLTAAEAAIGELHEQMLASSELIKALAEQNAQLIRRVETHRIRVLWLTGLTLTLAAVAVGSLVMWLTR